MNKQMRKFPNLLLVAIILAFGGFPPERAEAQAANAMLSFASISVLPEQQVTVPLALDLHSGVVYGVDISFTYDPTVVSVAQVTKGALASGWSLVSNLNSAGVVHIAMAGATPITTSGELVQITFTAGSTAGAETDLTLTRGELNEGGISTILDAGNLRIAVPVQASFTASPTTGPAPLSVSFHNASGGDFTTVLWDFGDSTTNATQNPTHVYTTPGIYSVTLTVSGPGGENTQIRTDYITTYSVSIAGQINYWNGDTAVENTALQLTGSNSYANVSNAQGSYAISNILAGSYTLAPQKNDEVRGITAFDASLILQHAAGLMTLSGYPAQAADVDQSGSVGTMDASYILQKSVGLIAGNYPGGSTVWKFNPLSRSYPALSSNLTGQDFTVFLLGDVSGNWATLSVASATSTHGVALRLEASQPDANGNVIVLARLFPQGSNVYSLQFDLSYDPAVVTLQDVSLGSDVSSWMLAKNLNQPGIARFALADTLPTTQDSQLLKLRFHLVKPAQSAYIQPLAGFVNESSASIEISGASIGGGNRIFLPILTRP